MKTLLMTCVYPEAVQYVSSFVDSLKQQSCMEFTLLVINDGVVNLSELMTGCPVEFHNLSLQGSPAKLRKAGIAWSVQNYYDVIIFADIDDCFASNRVEVSRRMLEKNSIVFNELMLFTNNIRESVPMLRTRFFEGEVIQLEQLLCSNCLGLSNTSAHLEVISESSSLTPDNIIAFDWALYSRVFFTGVKAVYTAQTNTYYRQHTSNIAGPRNLTDNDIRRGVAVKARHYAAIRTLGTAYESMAIVFSDLEARLAVEPVFSAEYFHAVRARAPENPLWWESIRTPKELCLC